MHRKALYCPWCKARINHVECYDQTDVDEFKHCHLRFDDTYEAEVILKDANLADIVSTIGRNLGWHIEWEVEDEATRYSRYDPRDEYVKPEERWPNDR